MRILAATLLTLGTQLVLGAAAFSAIARLLVAFRARRRWLVAWARSAKMLARLVPLAVAAAGFGLGLGTASPGGSGSLFAAIWARPIAFLLVGSLPASACVVMLGAGRQEARGHRRRARLQGRLAGELIFAGALALLVLVWSGLLFRVPLRRALVSDTSMAGVVMLAAMLGLGFAAFVGVTGGLAGKPRPSSYFAGACFAGGVAGLIAAYQMTL